MEKDFNTKIANLQTKFYKACHGKEPENLLPWNKERWNEVNNSKPAIRLSKLARQEK